MLAKKAQRANIAFSPQALIGIMALLSVFAFLMLSTFTAAALGLRVVLGIAMGVGGVFVWVNRTAKKRMTLLEEREAPDSIELMVAPCRSATRSPPPSGSSQRDPRSAGLRIRRDLRRGRLWPRRVGIAQAFAERMDSQDL